MMPHSDPQNNPELFRRNTIHTNATNDITLISCTQCGGYVADPGAHLNACPRIQPVPPDPIDVMVAIVEAMRKAAYDRGR